MLAPLFHIAGFELIIRLINIILSHTFHFMPRSDFTWALFVRSTKVEWHKFLFCFFVFFVKIWL